MSLIDNAIALAYEEQRHDEDIVYTDDYINKMTNFELLEFLSRLAEYSDKES